MSVSLLQLTSACSWHKAVKTTLSTPSLNRQRQQTHGSIMTQGINSILIKQKSLSFFLQKASLYEGCFKSGVSGIVWKDGDLCACYKAGKILTSPTNQFLFNSTIIFLLFFACTLQVYISAYKDRNITKSKPLNSGSVNQHVASVQYLFCIT